MVRAGRHGSYSKCPFAPRQIMGCVVSRRYLGSEVMENIMAGRALKIDPKQTVKTGPEVQSSRTESIEQSEIAARAYECWQERGCPSGSDQEDWFKAERELQRQKVQPPEAA